MLGHPPSTPKVGKMGEEELSSPSEEIEVVAEEDLLSMIQKNLFDQYKVSCKASEFSQIKQMLHF